MLGHMNTSYTPPTTLYRWRFGSLEYDEAQRELRIAGLAVEMENRPLEVLSLLLRHVGEVVTKQELFDQVWAGRPTVDHVLSTAVGKLRKVLEAAGEPRIVTVPRIGYRFDGPVERVTVGQQASSGLELAAGQTVPGRPHFQLERLLGRTLGSEVWLARQPRSRDGRVFKFALDGERLSAIKREATLARVLRDSLGERDDLARVLDWNFEQPPFFLECEYGGQSLPEWAEQDDRLAALSREQRLHLFLQIADTVAAAHGVGVLHKDIKPSNVLVAAQGDGWRTRLTDFGNSRLLQPERLAELGITSLGLTTTRTDTSGTPLYLAPELIAGQSASIRSDLYALGVVLYQLVVGDLHQPLAPGWERGIDDELLAADIARATDLDPARRHASVAELAQQLRQLETRRDEQRQRQQAEQNAATLRRALERTRARRPWVIAAGLALSAGLVLSLWQYRRAESALQDARREATTAQGITKFMIDTFKRAGPTTSGRADVTVLDALKAALPKIDETLGEEALAVRAALHAALGSTLPAWSETKLSIEEGRKAVAAYEALQPADREKLAETRCWLAYNLARTGTMDEATTLLDAVAPELPYLRETHPQVALRYWRIRGTVSSLSTDTQSALHANREALKLLLSLPQAEQPKDVRNEIEFNIANDLALLSKFDESIAMLRPLIERRKQELGPRHQHTLYTMVLLANSLVLAKRFDEARDTITEASGGLDEVLGPQAGESLMAKGVFADLELRQRRFAEAATRYAEVHAGMVARFGEHNRNALNYLGNHAHATRLRGDPAGAESIYRRLLGVLRERQGDDHPQTQLARYGLATCLLEQGKSLDEAKRLLHGLHPDLLKRAETREDWQALLDYQAARIALARGNRDEALTLLRQASAGFNPDGFYPDDAPLKTEKLLASADGGEMR